MYAEPANPIDAPIGVPDKAREAIEMAEAEPQPKPVEKPPVEKPPVRSLDSRERLRRADLSDSRLAMRQQDVRQMDYRDQRANMHPNAYSQGNNRRARMHHPGGPGDGDDSSSSDDSFLPENLPGLPPLKKKKKTRREQSPPPITSSRPRVNAKYYVPSAAVVPTYSAARSASAYVAGAGHIPTLVNNAEQYILQVLEPILNVEPEDLPVMNKNFKPSAPKAYAGEDNNELFYNWTQNTTRYFWLMRMVGQSSEELRIYALGEGLTGIALEWYNAEVTSPNRDRQHWTFVDVILELHNRFVHHATVQLASDKFENVEYHPQKGVAGLYSEMLRYAKQMVEFPGDYTFRRKFLKELPEDI